MLYTKTFIHFLLYLAQFFLQREIFRQYLVEKIKTHVQHLFSENCVVYENVKKQRTVGKATHYKRTPRICDTYCFCTATIFEENPHNYRAVRTLSVLYSFSYSYGFTYDILYCISLNGKMFRDSLFWIEP